jgi:hypothetical protein
MQAASAGGYGRMRMLNPVRGLSILLAAFAFLFLVPGTIPAEGTEGGSKSTLDGKVFIVEVGKKGKKADGKDVFIFKNGKFHSTIRDKWEGIGEGAYTSTTTGDAVTFEADTRSESRGTIRWEGTVRGNTIDVRYIWTDKPKWYRPNPRPAAYWARGEDLRTPAGGEGGNPGPSNLLDGKTFFALGGAKGKKADHDDYLIFRDGMFVSSGCVELNFGKSTYSATADGGAIRFRARAVSPTHGVMVWEGAVRGNVLEATVGWIHAVWHWKIDREYWYRGRLHE